MQVLTTEDAKVLVPNKEHQNFTATDLVIPSGTTLKGEVKYVDGMRRGEPFKYKLFKTENSQFIYLNKTQTKHRKKIMAATWTDELKQEVIAKYEAAGPTPAAF